MKPEVGVRAGSKIPMGPPTCMLPEQLWPIRWNGREILTFKGVLLISSPEIFLEGDGTMIRGVCHNRKAEACSNTNYSDSSNFYSNYEISSSFMAYNDQMLSVGALEIYGN